MKTLTFAGIRSMGVYTFNGHINKMGSKFLT
jgi:hypothetical protein